MKKLAWALSPLAVLFVMDRLVTWGYRFGHDEGLRDGYAEGHRCIENAVGGLETFDYVPGHTNN